MKHRNRQVVKSIGSFEKVSFLENFDEVKFVDYDNMKNKGVRYRNKDGTYALYNESDPLSRFLYLKNRQEKKIKQVMFDSKDNLVKSQEGLPSFGNATGRNTTTSRNSKLS